MLKNCHRRGPRLLMKTDGLMQISANTEQYLTLLIFRVCDCWRQRSVFLYLSQWECLSLHRRPQGLYEPWAALSLPHIPASPFHSTNNLFFTSHHWVGQNLHIRLAAWHFTGFGKSQTSPPHLPLSQQSWPLPSTGASPALSASEKHFNTSKSSKTAASPRHNTHELWKQKGSKALARDLLTARPSSTGVGANPSGEVRWGRAQASETPGTRPHRRRDTPTLLPPRAQNGAASRRVCLPRPARRGSRAGGGACARAAVTGREAEAAAWGKGRGAAATARPVPPPAPTPPTPPPPPAPARPDPSFSSASRVGEPAGGGLARSRSQGRPAATAARAARPPSPPPRWAPPWHVSLPLLPPAPPHVCPYHDSRASTEAGVFSASGMLGSEGRQPRSAPAGSSGRPAAARKGGQEAVGRAGGAVPLSEGSGAGSGGRR